MEGIGRPPPRDGPPSAARTTRRHRQRTGRRVASVRPLARTRHRSGRVPRRDSSVGTALPVAAGHVGRPPELYGELPILPHRSDGVRKTDRCHCDPRHAEHGRGRRLGAPRPARGPEGPRRCDRSPPRGRNASASPRQGGGFGRPGAVLVGSHVRRDAPIL